MINDILKLLLMLKHCTGFSGGGAGQAVREVGPGEWRGNGRRHRYRRGCSKEGDTRLPTKMSVSLSYLR